MKWFRHRVSLVPLLLAAVATTAASLAADDAPAATEKGLFVAVGYGGRRMSSADGIHWENDTQWSEKAADNDDVLFNVAYGQGKFVAVGGGAKIGHVLVTRDGKEWKEAPQQRGRVATVAFGDDKWVAGHSNDFLFSADGASWERGAKLDLNGSVHFRKSAFGHTADGKGLFVAIGDWDPAGGKRIWFRAATPDGQTVTALDPGAAEGRAIAFGAGRFVVVGPNGLRESSADGKTWEHRATEEGQDLNSVIWDGHRFIAAGGKNAFTSPDGVTWAKEPNSIPCSVLYGRAGLYLGGS